MHTEALSRSHRGVAPHANGALVSAIDTCFDCTQSCVACGDACLAEERPSQLARCIRICGECADICDVTGRLLSRRFPDRPQIWETQLRACIVACRMCAEECEQHAAHHEHCRICADACRECERACQTMIGTLGAATA